MDDRALGVITFGNVDREEHNMPELSVSEDTFRRLAAKAAALHISIADLVQPALDRLAENAPSISEPLAGDDWKAEFDEWKRDAERRAGRYPIGFALDDSREAIYRDREDAQR